MSGRSQRESMCSCAHVPMGTWHHGHMGTCRLLLPLLLILLLPLSTAAQTVGKLRFTVDPGSNYSFVLDHKFRMQQREVELTEGPHHFTFWAPQRRMLDTTLAVEAGRTREVWIRLPYSTEFVAYERELTRQKNENWLKMALPSAVTLGTGILAWSSWRRYKEAHDRLVEADELYRTSSDPQELADLRSVIIPSDKQAFKDRQRVWAISAGAFTAVAAVSTWMIVRTARQKAPTFQDAEKVRFDGLVWLPGERGGMVLTGMHIDLR